MKIEYRCHDHGVIVQGETNQDDVTGAGIVIAPARNGTRILNNIVQNNVSGLFLSNNSSTNRCLIQYNLFRNNNNDGENGGRGIYTNGAISGDFDFQDVIANTASTATKTTVTANAATAIHDTGT